MSQKNQKAPPLLEIRNRRREVSPIRIIMRAQKGARTVATDHSRLVVIRTHRSSSKVNLSSRITENTKFDVISEPKTTACPRIATRCRAQWTPLPYASLRRALKLDTAPCVAHTMRIMSVTHKLTKKITGCLSRPPSYKKIFVVLTKAGDKQGILRDTRRERRATSAT